MKRVPAYKSHTRLLARRAAAPAQLLTLLLCTCCSTAHPPATCDLDTCPCRCHRAPCCGLNTHGPRHTCPDQHPLTSAQVLQH